MTKYILSLFLFLMSSSLFAQQIIDNVVSFQTDPAKKYSIYVPSSYNPAQPNALMLGLHPLNTNRWNGKSWRDTLIAFAESNNLILVCPDGGADGRIDDAIDTAFTTFLLDSAEIWFNIDKKRVYAMGFSWGGLTTYSYGLARPARFGGYMPIGAAIAGTAKFSQYAANAKDKPFYLVHGANDNPNTRYTPALNWLNANNAIVNSKLLPGVGHTIDFTNRNQFLTDAYKWLDSVNTSINSGFENDQLEQPSWNYFIDGNNLTLRGEQINWANLYSIDGKLVDSISSSSSRKSFTIPKPGIYIIELSQNNKVHSLKFSFLGN